MYQAQDILENNNDEIVFAPEQEELLQGIEEFWKILIVDDDEDIHKVTKFALQDFTYKGKKLKFLDTYSAKETQQVLNEHTDIAAILLDVVMESIHAGLDLVKYVRQEIKNKEIQIVLRTGQAGYAPEKEVISAYEINDYKAKTELTEVKLFTVIMSSLRSYEALMQLQEYSKGLEQKVKERTLEIEQQKTEIEKKNKSLMDSIYYAQHIQDAMLPSPDVLTANNLDYFLIFKPLQVVSGDFYWFKQIKNFIYIVAADCTGHGVPGALMSMLGMSQLNEIISKRDVNPPNEILNELRKRVKKSLHQVGQAITSQDGMDIALCIIDLEEQKLQYAGAYNPLYLVRSHEGKHQLIEIKGDKMPVGIHPRDSQSFSSHEMQLQKGDTIYIFTDGITTQFGGDELGKFKSRRLQDVLLHIQGNDMETQKRLLEKTFKDWQGENEQVDDNLMIGLKY